MINVKGIREENSLLFAGGATYPPQIWFLHIAVSVIVSRNPHSRNEPSTAIALNTSSNKAARRISMEEDDSRDAFLRLIDAQV